MSIEVKQIPCLSDNYGFLVHDTESGATASIDTPEAAAINSALAQQGWTLTHILNTHHHFDHAGGNEELKAQWGCQIIGAANDAHRIPGIDQQVVDGEWFHLGNSAVQVLEVPGHTLGHIAYYFANDKAAFVGDTLFALGCGRMFEGTAQQMWASLEKLMALPDETVVYCAHEYTQANAAFAITVEPDNSALQQRTRDIARLREQGIPTVPTTIGLERQTNPFVRPHSDDLQRTIDCVGADAVAIFAETRKRKDNF
ncbi:MAG: hydroxyacylglutathione hydrolase [Proteobacteria bacterium]|nr:hydroxyacylglutathione hydrolase [Pseudomonadota bacterium]